MQSTTVLYRKHRTLQRTTVLNREPLYFTGNTYSAENHCTVQRTTVLYRKHGTLQRTTVLYREPLYFTGNTILCREPPYFTENHCTLQETPTLQRTTVLYREPLYSLLSTCSHPSSLQYQTTRTCRHIFTIQHRLVGAQVIWGKKVYAYNIY